LRNISLQGLTAQGTDGIRILLAGRVMIDHVTIDGFSGNAIGVNPTGSTGSTMVSVTNTDITGPGTGSATGIQITGLPGKRVNVSADHVSIRNTVNGIDAQFGSTALTNSVVANTTNVAIMATNLNTFLTAENNIVTG